MSPHEIVRRAFAQGVEIGKQMADAALEFEARTATAAAYHWHMRATYTEDEIREFLDQSLSEAAEEVWAEMVATGDSVVLAIEMNRKALS